jgi:hypothetical protein
MLNNSFRIGFSNKSNSGFFEITKAGWIYRGFTVKNYCYRNLSGIEL